MSARPTITQESEVWESQRNDQDNNISPKYRSDKGTNNSTTKEFPECTSGFRDNYLRSFANPRATFTNSPEVLTLTKIGSLSFGRILLVFSSFNSRRLVINCRRCRGRIDKRRRVPGGDTVTCERTKLPGHPSRFFKSFIVHQLNCIQSQNVAVGAIIIEIWIVDAISEGSVVLCRGTRSVEEECLVPLGVIGTRLLHDVYTP